MASPSDRLVCRCGHRHSRRLIRNLAPGIYRPAPKLSSHYATAFGFRGFVFLAPVIRIKRPDGSGLFIPPPSSSHSIFPSSTWVRKRRDSTAIRCVFCPYSAAIRRIFRPNRTAIRCVLCLYGAAVRRVFSPNRSAVCCLLSPNGATVRRVLGPNGSAVCCLFSPNGAAVRCLLSPNGTAVRCLFSVDWSSRPSSVVILRVSKLRLIQ